MIKKSLNIWKKNMVALIDTNIIIDYLVNGEPFSNDAEKIIELCKDGKFSGFIAIQSIVDCFYILRKVCSSDLYCIVTRNPKDYVSSSIDILTPKQFIDVIK